MFKQLVELHYDPDQEKIVEPLKLLQLTPSPSNPGDANTIWINSVDGDVYQGNDNLVGGGAAGVTGPVASTVTALARWGDVTGDTLTDSSVLLDTDGNATGVNSIDFVVQPFGANPGGSETLWFADGFSGFMCGDFPMVMAAVAGPVLFNSIPVFGSPDGNIIYSSGANLRLDGDNLLLIGEPTPNNITGILNTHFGAEAGNNTSPLAVDGNSFFGAHAGSVNTGEYNTAVGAYALRLDATGVGLNAVHGARALQSCTNAELSVAVGAECAANATQVENDVFVGHRAGYSVGTSGTNVIVGAFAAGFELVTPVTGFEDNVFIGNLAGHATGLLDGCARNSLIGATAGTAITNNTDCIYLENLGVAGEDNAIRLGDSARHFTAYMAGVQGVPPPAGTNEIVTINQTTKQLASVPFGGGTGDVVGPASSTDNALARFDGVTGKLIQNSNVTLANTGVMSFGVVGSGIILPNDPVLHTGTELAHWERSSASYAFTGPWLGTYNAGLSMERIGNVVTITNYNILTELADGVPAPIVATTAVPAGFRPVGGFKHGLCVVADGVTSGGLVGSWDISVGGILSFYPNPSGGQSFGVGVFQVGLPVVQAYTYMIS